MSCERPNETPNEAPSEEEAAKITEGLQGIADRVRSDYPGFSAHENFPEYVAWCLFHAVANYVANNSEEYGKMPVTAEMLDDEVVDNLFRLFDDGLAELEDNFRDATAPAFRVGDLVTIKCAPYNESVIANFGIGGGFGERSGNPETHQILNAQAFQAARTFEEIGKTGRFHGRFEDFEPALDNDLRYDFKRSVPLMFSFVHFKGSNPQSFTRFSLKGSVAESVDNLREVIREPLVQTFINDFDNRFVGGPGIQVDIYTYRGDGNKTNNVSVSIVPLPGIDRKFTENPGRRPHIKHLRAVDETDPVHGPSVAFLRQIEGQ